MNEAAETTAGILALIFIIFMMWNDGPKDIARWLVSNSVSIRWFACRVLL